MDDFNKKVLNLHKKNIGKLDVLPNIPLETQLDLSMAYTPGVAIPCLDIVEDNSKALELTLKGKTVAIVTDGSAVLGLGNIGPLAALPVMEGKSALLYHYSGIQAFPICLNTQNPDEIIKTVINISPVFAAIMLEDIKSPNCVYIEKELQKALDIPVFHDDQHGTAIVVGAALKNAAKLLNLKLETLNVVVCGTGAAGSAIIKMLNKIGIKKIHAINENGVLNKNNFDQLNSVEKELIINKMILSPKNDNLTLKDIIKNKDVFIGVSTKDILTEDMVKSMSENKIIFALANPNPEIKPETAKKAGARIIGTGRSDYPNQINNVLIFPGLMKGLIKSKSKMVTDKMKLDAIDAIANLVSNEELSFDHILPSIFNKNVVDKVAEAIIKNKA
ncbi:MAG: NAD-dependent malic enzyme [Tenericutes bacterium 4572_104]|nr:MAG: NAD-dependent malic enzyme [Tenericutes bacterium 4572_104]